MSRTPEAPPFTWSEDPKEIDPQVIQRIQAFVCELLDDLYDPLPTYDQARMHVLACQAVTNAATSSCTQWQSIAHQAFLEVVSECPFNHRSLPSTISRPVR